MGSAHQLINYTDFKAAYYEGSSSLTLSANGYVHVDARGIGFNRIGNMGTIPMYELRAYIEQYIRGPDKFYDIGDRFDIHIPRYMTTIILVSAAYPAGKRFEIERHNVLSAATDDTTQTQTQTIDDPLAVPNEPVTEVHRIIAGLGVPFKIDTSAAPPDPRGTITLLFNNEHLQLGTAGVTGTKIYWRLNPTRIGVTDIVVTIAGGELPVVYQERYKVQVVPVDPPGVTATYVPPGDGLVSHQSVGDGLVSAQGSDRGGKGIENRIYVLHKFALGQHPNAKVYSLRAQSPDKQGVDDIDNLPLLVLVIRDQDDKFYQYESHSDGLYFTHSEIPMHIGVDAIDWPAFTSPITALNWLRFKGYKAKVVDFYLYRPALLPGGVDTYVFQFQDGRTGVLPDLPQIDLNEVTAQGSGEEKLPLVGVAA